MTDSNSTTLPSTESDQPKQSKTAEKKPAKSRPAKKPEQKNNTWVIVLLAIILSCIMALGFVYLWQLSEQQEQAIQHLQGKNNQLDKQLLQSFRQAENEIVQLQKKAEQQQELIQTLDKLALFNAKELNRLHASNRIDWLLAEAEYLLRLANQRLNIEDDVLGAENILIAADKVLAEADDPSLYAIRKVMAEEIMALQSISKLDHQGAYLKIQAIINQLENMSEEHFIGQEEEIAISETIEQEYEFTTLWHEIWDDLKKAVIIRRMDEPVPPLLAPEQSYYLKQNLRLMLEQAGSSLLQKQEQHYYLALDKAKNWIQDYFAQNNPETEALISAINHLRIVKVTQEKPDISNSVRLLKARIEVMYRQHQLSKQPANMPDVQQTDSSMREPSISNAPEAIAPPKDLPKAEPEKMSL